MIFADIDHNLSSQTNNFTRDCKYYDISQFSNLFKKNIDELAIVHFNLRSIAKNKYKVEEFLMQSQFLPGVIAISETKLNSSNSHLA